MSRTRFSPWLLLPLLSAVGLGAAGREGALVDAVKAGNTQAVRALLQQGSNVNAPATDGTTALHWAVYREDPASVDLLIRAGANVKATNRYGVTPLALACANANTTIIGPLLEAGADANSAAPGGETALMTAARTGSATAVKMLLAHGADVNAREATRGQTALMWAAAEGHAAVIETLIEAGADIYAASHAPAAAAASVGSGTYRRSVGRVDALTPLLFAVRGGHQDAVRALLDGGADVNETLPNGTSALVLAVFNAHYELAAFLLEQGADPNAAKQGWTALHQLLRTRNLNIGFFPHPEPTGRMSGLELGKQLIAHGADVNARMTKPIVDGFRGFWVQKGATPLLLAAKGGDAEMMRLLAAHGADPSLTNDKGTTPLMAASGVEMFNPNEDSGTNEDGLEALKVALELGGDVNAANKDGDTALHGAAWRGANDIVQLLVDRGAKLDVKNKQGYTPLRIANGEEERVANHNVRPWTVELLLKLLTERGLPTDMLGPEGRHAFEKQVAEEKSRPRRYRDQPPEDQATEPREDEATEPPEKTPDQPATR